MPEAALSRSELIQIYQEYRDAEVKREAAAGAKQEEGEAVATMLGSIRLVSSLLEARL